MGIIGHHHPGRRYALPRADLSQPLRGDPPRPCRSPTTPRTGRSSNGIVSIGSQKSPSNRERPAHRTSPAMENAVADRSNRSQRHRGGKDRPTGFSAARRVCPRTVRMTEAATRQSSHFGRAYRRFGPSDCSWAGLVCHPFAAGRPPPSQSNVILPHHGSGGKHFFSSHVPPVRSGQPSR